MDFLIIDWHPRFKVGPIFSGISNHFWVQGVGENRAAKESGLLPMQPHLGFDVTGRGRPIFLIFSGQMKLDYPVHVWAQFSVIFCLGPSFGCIFGPFLE